MKSNSLFAAAALVATCLVSLSADATPREIYWWGANSAGRGQASWADTDNWKDADGNLTGPKDGDIAIFDSDKWLSVTSYVLMNGTSAYQLIFRGTRGLNLSGYKAFLTPNEGIRVEGPFSISAPCWMGIGSKEFPIYLKESTSGLGLGDYLSGSAKVIKTGAGSLSLANSRGGISYGRDFTGSIDFSGGGTLTAIHTNAFGRKEALITSTDDEHCVLQIANGVSLVAPVRFVGPASPNWNMLKAQSGATTFALNGDVTLAEGTGLRMTAAANQAGTIKNLVLEGETDLSHEVSFNGAGSITIEKVTMPEGGTLVIPEGVTLNIGSVIVGETEYTLQKGILYSGNDGAGEVKYGWISGAGTIFAGHPDESAAESVTDATWTGATDSDLREAGNWNDETLPDFSADRVNAIFAAGGALAAETVCAPLTLDGITFNGTRDFTLAGPGRLYLGNGLKTVYDNANHHYAVTRPVWLRRGQIWTASTGASLWISNQIHSLSSTNPLILDGAGTFNLAATNDFANRVIVSNAAVHAYSDNAFGTSSSSVLLYNASGALYCHGVTLPNAFDGRVLYGERGTTNVIGSFYRRCTSSISGISGAATLLALPGSGKATFVVKGNFGVSGNGMGNTSIGDGSAPVVLIVTNGLLSAHDRLSINRNAEVHLWSTGNRTGGNSGSVEPTAKLYTHVPHAISRNDDWEGYGGLRFGGLWDLCGCDQELSVFIGWKEGEITSATPATLHHWSTLGLGNLKDHANGIVTCESKFTGYASFEYTGTVTNYTITSASTTQGSLIINPNAATSWMKITGSWANGSVIVSNGIWKITKAKSVGRKVAIAADGGTINIAEGVTEKVGSLTVKGVEMPVGVYGGPDSDAPNKPTYTDGGTDYIFSGKGVMRVGKIALIINFR